MTNVKDIWIVNPVGITLFHASVEEKSQDLIGSLFSSIQVIVSQMGENKMKALSLGSSKILCYQGQDDYLFILRYEKDEKTKKILKKMNIIEELFFDEYKHILKEWDGRTDYFNGFVMKIQNIFKDTPFISNQPSSSK
ncbi:MAG: hypothetical protein EAX96_16280 [Candidatus Lokiarchaeota archaeon]|nr:hypothetical protein [Candidatus Lokiarchaeota archaeon]